MSRLRNNVIANYANQIYTSIIGITLLPLYISHMGSESYGLIAFFTMLQAWLSLLDAGLSATIIRETARYRSGNLSEDMYIKLYRALKSIFWLVGLVSGFILFISSEIISSKWLNAVILPENDILFSLKIMAASVAIRWISGLYRGVVTGAERLVLLSCVNSFIATLRFVIVFFTMSIFGFEVKVFFIHQLIVVLLELLVLMWFSHLIRIEMKPIMPIHGTLSLSFHDIIKFSLTIAVTSSIWLLVTQIDKLILSGILSLSDYGGFVLVALVANTVMVISTPISSAIMPRMTKLCASGELDSMFKIYRNSTQVVSVICGTASIVLAFLAKPFLYTWTGDLSLAEEFHQVLALYALGNSFLLVSAFPYYLQYSIGNLKLHLIGNLGMFFLLVPAIVVASKEYGALGAAWVWFSINLVYFFLWVTYVHEKIKKGLHKIWIKEDIMPIYCSVVLSMFIFSFINFDNLSRIESLIAIAFQSIIAIFTAVLSSSFCRGWISNRIVFEHGK
ncbi:lipopolysaccharide biosynthesis protein [Vibrio lentus]|uniref:lipopolysaccharide biosynthesis protein n=1 Tax=Vibrio lentus TaxID=136468 RepID=UPI000C861F53|nr:polysaccharide biosynthesis protein [Vibrio lentus]PMM56250.1 polysaccharide biosynthesis protein [Vibrio lentus]